MNIHPRFNTRQFSTMSFEEIDIGSFSNPKPTPLPSLKEQYICFSEFADSNRIVTPHQILKPQADREWPCDPVALLELTPDGFPSAKLKKHVRKFVPCEFRRKMWLILSGGERIMKKYPSYYLDQSSKVQHVGAVPSFGSPYDTGIFPLTKEGHECRDRILRVIAYSQPNITYCPLLAVTVSILLCFMGEEESFFVILGLFESEKLEHSRPGVIAERNTLGDLTYNKARTVWKALYQIAYSVDPEASLNSLYPLFENWEAWIFQCIFFWALVRILDCYFVEGPKIFYRVGVSIVILFHKYVLKTSTKDVVNLKEELRQFASHLPVSDTELLDTGFNIPNLSRSLIQKFYKRHVLLNLSRISSNPEQVVIPAPKPDKPSKIIASEEDWFNLWQWLPERFQICTPQKIFEAETHGYNLTRLYDVLDETEPFILLIKTAEKQAFGAYCSMSLSNRIKEGELHFFGTGETFLFSFCFSPPKKFPWVGLHQSKGVTDMFMAGNDSYLVVGGGDGGFGIYLDNELNNGSTAKCSTFNNLPLCPSEAGSFACTAVEVYGFSDEDV